MPCAICHVPMFEWDREQNLQSRSKRKMPNKYQHCLSIIIDFMIYFYCKTFRLPWLLLFFFRFLEIWLFIGFLWLTSLLNANINIRYANGECMKCLHRVWQSNALFCCKQNFWRTQVLLFRSTQQCRETNKIEKWEKWKEAKMMLSQRVRTTKR